MTTQTLEPRMELEQHLHMFRQMAKIRAFEEQVNELYKGAKMPGLAHLYVGEEAVAVGVCEALRRDDFITSTHRGHGHCLAKGASVNRMFAELLGKEPGYCRGKGGSMHIADPETGNLGANAIVGGSAGIATGAALSAKMRGQRPGRGVLLRRRRARAGPALRGDEHGLAVEAARSSTSARTTSTASTRRPARRWPARSWPAPGRSASTPRASTARTSRRSTRTMRRLVERARRGEGPAFLECKTYRYYGHHVGDVNREYRTRDEERDWMTQPRPAPDPVRPAHRRRGSPSRRCSTASWPT